MAKNKNKRFVLGQMIPDWIESYSKTGRIKFEYDDENNVISATIHSPTGVKKAKLGDTIVSTGSGLIVVPSLKKRG